MQLTTYAMQRTGKTFDELFVSGKLARFAERADGGFTIAYWDASLGKTPSDAELDAAFAKPDPFLVPEFVSSAQAKIQLSRTPGAETGKSLLDDVTAAVQAAGIEAQIWFSESRSWERQNPNVLSLSAGLKLTDTQVDGLFVAAAQIAA